MYEIGVNIMEESGVRKIKISKTKPYFLIFSKKFNIAPVPSSAPKYPSAQEPSSGGIG